MTNAQTSAADRYYVYRPLLDLIGLTEGTDKRRGGGAARGYSETLAYGRLTGGDVDLVSMTLTQIDALQTRMLQHRENVWRSSALGRYQIVRTTLRSIRKTLPDRYPGTRLFDADCQDEMACFLLGQRGIDRYLAGRMSEDTLLLNLSQEWASLPTPAGKGYYNGQHAAVKPEQVRAVLAHVRRRHSEGQPKIEVPVPVEKPVVPEEVEQEAQKAERRGWWQWPSAGVLALIGGFYRDYPELAWAATGGVVVIGVVALIGGRGFVRRVKDIADEARF